MRLEKFRALVCGLFMPFWAIGCGSETTNMLASGLVAGEASPLVRADTSFYSFETSTQGWSIDRQGGTTTLAGGANGPGVVHDGNSSLFYHMVNTGGANTFAEVTTFSPPSLSSGQWLSFHIWLVPGNSALHDVQPFIKKGPNYDFTGVYLTANTGIVFDQWMEVFLQVPVNANSVVALGLGSNCSANCTGDFFIDSVTPL